MEGERPSRPVGPPPWEAPRAAASGDQRQTTGSEGLHRLQTKSALAIMETVREWTLCHACSHKPQIHILYVEQGVNPRVPASMTWYHTPIRGAMEVIH
jgi:hypothetical protein